MKAILTYERGTIKIAGDAHIPLAKFDSRSGCYRALAYTYRDITEYLERAGVEVEDRVLNPIPCPYLDADIELRPYQQQAVEAWMLSRRGCVVLPTGSGKTHVALHIIQRLSLPTLVVVPTLDLVDQWADRLSVFGVEWVGELSGRRKDIRPITVTTYDSAYANAERLGNRFQLLVFDEVHHLPSEAYSHIAEMSAAPHRLGLTATYEREDERHELLPRLVGGKVFELMPQELAGEHLASYVVERVYLPLTPEEQAEYDAKAKVFKSYIRKRGLTLRSMEDFRRVVMATGYDALAYEALKAWNEARRIAFSSHNKLVKLRELLEMHRRDKIIIFTRHNELVYRISREFLVPAITYKTPKEERHLILNGFREGTYRAVVSSQVLDEGIDVPDASVGIIMSGSGSGREFIQRLGRILRKKEGKEAVLYELVSKDTGEVGISRRRHASKGAS
ncbi:DEAD/DEAH box helicase family protein [Methermicoccus shengliensis]|uniref:DNA 3'-5' helicase n=1 Tax=Methermicoccus shengliensis TaxID=660064 RepID=A0A832RXA2_9EURY|nr:DEAD/DEAH box helicase family protein [Methermicoccus shengliensis]KUK04693.1 MAG: Type III restriction protein res subunit [Euryarchaeota archaeon 55_53]KUK30540.1 MAG: Type III restriction protein res subunit [Methanosarcinales archeaon 56_1174]MDI3487447.1 hypothetical protein [Methanosarcinales archaeon]MDN5295224.1 hypothetical protein [Methanosarcinales archaeon]HIH69687.1 DEAD/DEAH box helicase [Methermicoccus shengliensis]